MTQDNYFTISYSGIRGVWKKGLTGEKIYRLCLAASQIFKENGWKTVLIGRDTRKSGREIFCLAKNCFENQSFSVNDLGIIPTPTLQVYTKTKKVAGSLMISASHNPPKFNGLKFFEPSGKIFSHQELKKLVNLYEKQKPPHFPRAAKTGLGLEKPLKETYQLHFAKILQEVKTEEIREKRFKVVVDAGNGAGAFLDKMFLQKLGCQVWEINCQTDGHFRRKIEPLSENLTSLKKEVIRRKSDLGFAQDADADRLAIVDEKGQTLMEEMLLSLVVWHFLKYRAGKNKKVVVNLSTTKTIDDLVQEFGGQLFKVPVGEINLVEKQEEVKTSIGGEGHGGVIWQDICPGRDSFSAMALILELLSFSNKKVSQLNKKLSAYKMVKDKISWDKSKKLGSLWKKLQKLKWPEKIIQINRDDGLRIDFENSWITVRPSNTEPILRFIAEARTKSRAQQLIDLAKGEK